MKLLYNNAEINHLMWLSENIKAISSLIIASPYLAKDMNEFLEKFDFNSVKNITLITTFKPRDIEQYTKPFQLLDFCEFFNTYYPHCKYTIHINDTLHGKIYLSENWGIITSANFTKNGFVNNDEFGTVIHETDFLNSLHSAVLNTETFDYQDISFNQIKRAVQFAEAEQKLNPLQNQVKIDADILSKVATDTDINYIEPQYFLKPCGDSERPLLLESKEDFSSLNQLLHFSKKKPKGLRKGDVVIMFGVGSCALVSYYKVLSTIQTVPTEEQKQNPDKKRWPHFVEARNQSPQFGAKWYEYNLDRRCLVKEFHEISPNIPITANGSHDLGTLNYGSDKVLITKEFAEFLIDKIKQAVS